MKTKITNLLKNYTKFLISIYIIIAALRILETILIAICYELNLSIIKSETLGLISDILLFNLIICLLFPIYYLLSKIKLSNTIFISFTYLVVFIQFFVLRYFIYQLMPLDTFIYKYPIEEILFTLKTANLSIIWAIVLLFIMLLLVFVGFRIGYRLNINPKNQKITLTISIALIPLYLLLNHSIKTQSNNFVANKLAYFTHKTITYLLCNDYNNSFDYEAFKAQNLSKDYINPEYPLMYNIKRNDEFGKHFDKFESAPNIVVIIVEGLSDDFIHEYNGAMLMPFLNKLKDKSLYWNKCFTLGERSFAVVPSMLGGLPYGEAGFTIQHKIPRHLSLVSVLNANNYFTSFFYTQGAWFHSKDAFFCHNNIDLIFDKDKYSSKYEKIIVENNNYFWGYNDKDMFNQSLEIIDTINSPRLDIYFTGTTHSPYIINNEEYYSKKLQNLINNQNKKFFTIYSKYLKTILFADDALENFFDKYKTRHDYHNTIFIITGDHPMSEIPTKNLLKRYHVPLIIFSEKLNTAKTFNNTVTHLDIPETLLGFLQNYINIIPSISTSLGDFLIPDKHQIESKKRFALMNQNREIIEYYYDKYFLSQDKLFEHDSALNIKETDSAILKNMMTKELNNFKNISLYTCLKNKIISNDTYCNELNYYNNYSLQNSDELQIPPNFEHYIIKNIEIPNEGIVLDVNFKISNSFDTKNHIVYYIADPEGKYLHWQNYGIEKDKPSIQLHANINKCATTHSTLYFGLIIENSNHNTIKISDLDVLLYRPNKQPFSNSTYVKAY
jgi:uncharacterized sulfatase